jgi:hypothetical protein
MRSSCYLCIPPNFGSDRRGNTSSNSSSVVIPTFPVCIPPIVAKQRLCKHVPAATNTHATIEELYGVSFLCGPCHIGHGPHKISCFILVCSNGCKYTANS